MALGGVQYGARWRAIWSAPMQNYDFYQFLPNFRAENPFCTAQKVSLDRQNFPAAGNKTFSVALKYISKPLKYISKLLKFISKAWK